MIKLLPKKFYDQCFHTYFFTVSLQHGKFLWRPHPLDMPQYLHCVWPWNTPRVGFCLGSFYIEDHILKQCRVLYDPYKGTSLYAYTDKTRGAKMALGREPYLRI